MTSPRSPRARDRRVRLLGLIAVLVAVAVPWSSAPAAAQPVWSAEYFANPTLSGTPALVRDDPAVDFDWGEGSPDPVIPVDGFSVRWTSTLALAAGTYRFATTSDDGVRLYVDGLARIDHWVDQGPTTWTADVELSEGDHTVVMEYYENGWGAVARLTYGSISAPPPDTWQGEYFTNSELAGTPLVVRGDPTIDFDWGEGAPATGLPVDNFSVRWTRTLTLEAGTWRFSTITDDGVRLYVDGVLAVDRWVGQAPTEWQADVELTAGPHTIVMEYFEAYGGAVAHLVYGNVTPPAVGVGWSAEYYANANLQNQPVVTRIDPAIDFDWGPGTPLPGLPSDSFSVRWTRTLTLAGGDYHLSTATDDGVRVIVDGGVVIDDWSAHAIAGNEADLTLAGGDHTVIVEYFDSNGLATARFNWAQRPGPGIVRLNPGGGAHADTQNLYWEADAFATGGATSEEAQPIANTTDDPLYINERAGAFSYDIPMAAGSYDVRLHFTELFFNSPGVRRFNVAIEGTTVLSSFDIYDQAGKASLITKSFPVTVTDGTLNIAFSKIFDNASIHAIDVYPAGTRDLTAPTFAEIPEPQNATHTEPPTVTLGIADDAALADGYWRIDDGAPQPLFSDLTSPAFDDRFTIPLETFNDLSLGSHTLSFGANDPSANASTIKWRFRKLTSGSGSVPIAFDRRVLVDPATPGASLLKHPTTIELGPDGRLWVGQQDGRIHVLTLDADRNVTAVERFDTIYNTPNVNPDGSPAPAVKGRHLIGLDFDPASTPTRPVVWAIHSDPRFCFNKTPETCGVNTESGVLTRLVGPALDDPANRTDVVTGLPRSRENHAPNAVHFGPDGWLYLTIGSNTNYGAPSTAFSFLPEVYLTAAVVRFNVNGAAGSYPMDVRTVDSPEDLVPGVFEMFATGYRNPYDFVWHSNGNLYANVNDGNFTAGNTPGPEHGCPDGVSFDPGTRSDFLALVDQGDYGGNPNPARGECILAEGTMYTPPKTPEPAYDPSLLVYFNGTSSNGIDEYTAPTFGGQLMGNLISATFAGSQSVRRVVLAPDGQSVQFEEDLAIFNQPLDVTVGGEGSIYVAEYGANDIQIMEPDPPMEGTWDFKAPLPVPTQEVGVTACNGKVYVVGGLTAPSVDTNALWAYDPGTDAWVAAAPYPGQPVDHPGFACSGGKLYLFGGLVSVGAAVPTTWEYDPATDSWTQRADMPQPRGAMGTASLDGKVYSVGGLGYPAKNDLLAFDPATNTWQTRAPMPTARDHLSVEVAGGQLHAVGGRNVTASSVLATNEVYDPVTDTWSARSPMPVARAGTAAADLHGHIQIWGGEGPSGTPSGTYAQGHDYDPRTDTWTTIAGEPTPRHGTDGAMIGDLVYVPGGGPQTGNSVTDVNEVFSFISTEPPPSCIEPGSDPATTDSDGDLYTDEDEIANNTDPCSPASVPPDDDGDRVSDRNDPDDDNDGTPDGSDRFQLDPANGTATALPWIRDWNPGDPPAGKYANSGFPGVQLTGSGAGYIDGLVHVGGAGGFLSLNTTGGTNRGAINTQDNALQVGFDATGPVTVSAQLADPLSGQVVEPGKSGGIFVGLGEDDYVELALASDDGTGQPGLVLGVEIDGVHQANPSITPVPINLTGLTSLDLFLVLDPAAGQITARYRINSDDPAAVATFGTVGTTQFPGLADLFVAGLGGGIIGTNGASSPFGLAYNWFRIQP